jgi:uncharacterized protein YycO
MFNDFKTGDILFQDLKCGTVCDAINGVTPGYKNADLNHCAIFYMENGQPMIIEALPTVVSKRTLSSFLNRSHDSYGRPCVMVGRLKPEFTPLISKSIDFCLKNIGVPYDSIYADNTTALYCSELIVAAFKAANNDHDFIPKHKLQFIDPKTGEIHPFWIAYYKNYGMEVPVNEIGSNPGTLSLSPKLDIIAQLGDLTNAPKPYAKY